MLKEELRIVWALNEYWSDKIRNSFYKNDTIVLG
jgi:hypothetical protein